MQDISEDLTRIINDKQCSSLLAFIAVKDGLHIQESESEKESCGRLRDTRDSNSDR